MSYEKDGLGNSVMAQFTITWKFINLHLTFCLSKFKKKMDIKSRNILRFSNLQIGYIE